MGAMSDYENFHPKPTDDETRASFQQRKFKALLLLEQSMSPNIRQLLASAGYDRHADDPYHLWQITANVIGQRSNSHMMQLQERLARLSRSNFPSLQAFIQEAVTLRESLKYQNPDFGDGLIFFAIFKGLEGHYVTEMTIYKNDYRKKQITWVEFIRALYELAASENVASSLVIGKKATKDSEKVQEDQPKQASDEKNKSTNSTKPA